MSNHVHLVVIPHKAEALGFAFKQAHGRYASYWNASHRSSGHAWQGRFYSCPLDTAHLWEALRYTELNPVRAKLVSKPEEWPWSSAAAHCGIADPDVCLTMEGWRAQWTVARWRDFLGEGESESQLAAIRRVDAHRPAAWVGGVCRDSGKEHAVPQDGPIRLNL